MGLFRSSVAALVTPVMMTLVPGCSQDEQTVKISEQAAKERRASLAAVKVDFVADSIQLAREVCLGKKSPTYAEKTDVGLPTCVTAPAAVTLFEREGDKYVRMREQKNSKRYVIWLPKDVLSVEVRSTRGRVSDVFAQSWTRNPNNDNELKQILLESVTSFDDGRCSPTFMSPSDLTPGTKAACDAAIKNADVLK